MAQRRPRTFVHGVKKIMIPAVTSRRPAKAPDGKAHVKRSSEGERMPRENPQDLGFNGSFHPARMLIGRGYKYLAGDMAHRRSVETAAAVLPELSALLEQSLRANGRRACREI
jgi:hypothetical protein